MPHSSRAWDVGQGSAWTSASGLKGKGTICSSVHPFIPLGPPVCRARGGHLQPQPPSLSSSASLVGAIVLILTTEQLRLGDVNKQLQVSLSNRTQQIWWGRGGGCDRKGRGLSVSFHLSQRVRIMKRHISSPQITRYKGRRRSNCPTSPLERRPHPGTSHRGTHALLT